MPYSGALWLGFGNLRSIFTAIYLVHRMDTMRNILEKHNTVLAQYCSTGLVYLPGSSIDVSPKLVLSEELKRFQEQEEEIVPKSILRSQERPNNALVLWKPPGGDVINLIRASNLQIQNDEELSEIDNNNSMLPDLNQSRP
ncbi:hypothetical protein QYM36_005104, partial [Artemia franciscana]